MTGCRGSESECSSPLLTFHVAACWCGSVNLSFNANFDDESVGEFVVHAESVRKLKLASCVA